MFKRVSYVEYIDHSQLFDSLEAIVNRYAKCLESDEIDLEAFNALVAFFSEETGLNNLDIDFDYIQWQCVFGFYETALDVLLTVENRLLEGAFDRLRCNFRDEDRNYFKRMLVLNAEQFACVVDQVGEAKSRLTEILGRLREYSKRFRTGNLVKGDAVDMVSQAFGMVDGSRDAMVESLDGAFGSSKAFKLEGVYEACRDDALFLTRIEKRLPFLGYPLLATALRRKDLRMTLLLARENGLSEGAVYSFFESEHFRGISDDEELFDFLLDVLTSTESGRTIEFEKSPGSYTARAGERLTSNYRGERAFLGALLARMVVERSKEEKAETGAMVHAIPAWARNVRDQSPVTLEAVRRAMALVEEPGQKTLRAVERRIFGPTAYQRCRDLVEGFNLGETAVAEMNTSLYSYKDSKSEVEFLGRVAEFLEGREGLEEPLLNVYRKLLSLLETQKAAQQNAVEAGRKKKKKKKAGPKTPLEKRIATCKSRIKTLTAVLEDRCLRENALPTIKGNIDKLFERGVGAVNMHEMERALCFSEANVASAGEYLRQGFLRCLDDVDVTQANTVEVYDLYKSFRRAAEAARLTRVVGLCDSVSGELIQRIDHDEEAIFWLNWPMVIMIATKEDLKTALLEVKKHLDRFDNEGMYRLRTLRGLVLAELKEVDEAYKVLNGVVSDSKHLDDEYAFIARAYLSFVCYEKKEKSRAKTLDEELERRAADLKNAKLYYVLGRTRYHKRKYNAALVALGDARALDRGYEDPMFVLSFWAAKEKADKVAPYYRSTEVRMTPWHFAQINLPSYRYFIGRLKEAGLFEHYREVYREKALRDLIKKLQGGMPFWDDDFEESNSARERIIDLYEDLYAGGLILQMTTPQLSPYLEGMEKRDLFVMNGFVIEMLGSGLRVDIVTRLLSVGKNGKPVDILASRLDTIRGKVIDGEIDDPRSLAYDLRQRIEQGAYRNHLIDQDLVVDYLGRIENGSREGLVLEPSNSKRVVISPSDFLVRLRYLVDTYDKLHEGLAEASKMVVERQRRKREREGRFLLELTERSPNTRFTRALVTIAGVSTVNPMVDLFYIEDTEPAVFEVSGIAVFITNTWDPDEAKAQIEKLLGYRSLKTITVR